MPVKALPALMEMRERAETVKPQSSLANILNISELQACCETLSPKIKVKKDHEKMYFIHTYTHTVTIHVHTHTNKFIHDKLHTNIHTHIIILIQGRLIKNMQIIKHNEP